MSDRETFYITDRPILVYEARRPSIEHFDDPDGVAAQPEQVEVRFFNGTDGELVEIDGSDVVLLGPPGSLVYMVEMDPDHDRGALLYIGIPGEVSDVAGNYTVYITTTYGDGLRITHDQKVQIVEYR